MNSDELASRLRQMRWVPERVSNAPDIKREWLLSDVQAVRENGHLQVAFDLGTPYGDFYGFMPVHGSGSVTVFETLRFILRMPSLATVPPSYAVGEVDVRARLTENLSLHGWYVPLVREDVVRVGLDRQELFEHPGFAVAVDQLVEAYVESSRHPSTHLPPLNVVLRPSKTL